MWQVHSSRLKEYAESGYPKSRQNHDATIDKLESNGTAPIQPSIRTLLLRGIVIIIYLLLGALVFRALEYKERDKTYLKKTLEQDRNELIRQYNISVARLEQYEELFRKRYLEILKPKKDWDYYQSLYFASTVTTTIGYGHITPQTQSGRLFLIIYALVGIPLNILALASVGEHITVAIFYALRFVSIRQCNRRKLNHINIKVMLVSVMLMVLMLVLGGVLYKSTEEWSYVDSIYYCFVAMATIGFGDLVPNRGKAPDSDREKAIWFLRALYISIGLSLVSTVFTALSNAMEEINLLLGRGKYGNTWLPNHKENSGDEKEFKNTKTKREESEKISYKHQIKEQGSYVMKYKVFKKFHRKKRESFTQSDWDGLLAASKRKQSVHSSSLTCSPVPRIDLSPPTSMTSLKDKRLAQQKYVNESYPRENLLLLPMDCDTNSSRISASEDSSPTDDDMLNERLLKLRMTHSFREGNKLCRNYSSSLKVNRRFSHQNVSRNHSYPVNITRNEKERWHDQSRQLENHFNPHGNDLKFVQRNFTQGEKWDTKLTEDDYEILLNQC